MSKVIASDVPAWLSGIIKKIKYDHLNIIQKSAISVYLSSLPSKYSSYDIEAITTSVPQEFLDKFNKVDYRNIDASKKKDMQTFLTNYVKQNKLI